MNRTIGERLARNLGTAIFGRAEERRALRSLLSGDARPVIYLHGLSGIGKSTLPAVLCREARELGGSAIGLDGRLIEPTQHGFLSEMANALGWAPGLTAVTDSIAGQPQPVLIALDRYELLTLLDAWLSQVLIPALPGEGARAGVQQAAAFAGVARGNRVARAVAPCDWRGWTREVEDLARAIETVRGYGYTYRAVSDV